MLTLVLGGIRSGKSAFAAELAGRSGGPVTYLATGVASDPEMTRRIEAHRRSRPPAWSSVEEPLAIVAATPAGADTVLLESVDGWLANRMEAADGASIADAGDGALEALVGACAAELESLRARCRHLVAVSAEVGLAPVPLHPYGRAFADALGMLNQRLAAAADEVHLVVAGLPLTLRGPCQGPSEGRPAP
jgi:adenosylcobinamide kinase/adenosylcobinamide-phosphate guanylyltransferase